VGLLIGGGIGYLLTANAAQKAQKQAEGSNRQTLTNTRLRKLYHLLAELTSSLSYERVIEKVLDASFVALDISQQSTEKLISAVLFFTEDGTETPYLRVASGRGLPRPDLHRKTPGMQGVLKNAIESGDPKLTQDPRQDPELSKFIAFRACQTAHCIPLRVVLDTFGVLVFGHPDPQYFTTERREILNIVSHQSTVALQNAQLFQELKDEKAHIIEVQEEARKKLARDLHDGPTQSVAAIAMQLNYARHMIKSNPESAEEEIYRTEEMARRTTKEIRHMLFTLRPLVLESEGLTAALNSMAEKTKETYDQNVIVETDEELIASLEMSAKTVIFTIAEEAVNNARKHARAKHIWVRVKKLKREYAMLEIEDDGVGFDLEEVNENYESRGSLGMINMQERAALARGLFHIESKPRQGTKVQVVIPLTDNAADQLRKI
jgi:signal transduction histidine kinase